MNAVATIFSAIHSKSIDSCYFGYWFLVVFGLSSVRRCWMILVGTIGNRTIKGTETTMSTRVRWLGHSALLVECDGRSVLIDPFLTGNPQAAVKADDVKAELILDLTWSWGPSR